MGYVDDNNREWIIECSTLFIEENKIIYDLLLNEEKNYIPTLNIAYLPHNKNLFICN